MPAAVVSALGAIGKVLLPFITSPKVLTALASTVTGLLVPLIVQGLKKLNFSLTQDQQAQLTLWVREAVLAVEESMTTAPSQVKLNAAVTRVQNKAPNLPLSTIVDAIHAELAGQRGGVGPRAQTPSVPPVFQQQIDKGKQIAGRP